MTVMTMAKLLAILLLLQAPRTDRVFEKPLDDTYLIALIRTITPAAAGVESVAFRVVLEERANRSRSWDLETIRATPHNHEVVRANSGSVVLRRSSDYGFNEGYIKLFFDPASKKVTRRVEFTDTGLLQIADNEIQRTLGVTAEFARQLKTPFEPKPLPADLIAATLPQSTYADFARLRPARVKDGYGPGSKIREMIEAYQVAGNLIWFGKSFYDGEGITGVGAIGSFDRTTKRFAFLQIPEVVDWSVSNLLIEGDTIWAGLVRHPEGADRSGGLLRRDNKSGRSQKYAVDDVIFRIERWRGGLYLTTSNGIYVLTGERITRHRVEPDINGKPALVSEQL